MKVYAIFLALVLQLSTSAFAGDGRITFRINVGYPGWAEVKCWNGAGKKTLRKKKVYVGGDRSCFGSAYMRVDYKNLINQTIRTRRYHRGVGTNPDFLYYSCDSDSDTLQVEVLASDSYDASNVGC